MYQYMPKGSLDNYLFGKKSDVSCKREEVSELHERRGASQGLHRDEESRLDSVAPSACKFTATPAQGNPVCLYRIIVGTSNERQASFCAACSLAIQGQQHVFTAGLEHGVKTRCTAACRVAEHSGKKPRDRAVWGEAEEQGEVNGSKKARFEGHPAALLPELYLVEQEDRDTHEISLLEDLNAETSLDILNVDPSFVKYEKIMKRLRMTFWQSHPVMTRVKVASP
ncbi:hypothetical protein L7F22_020341 [Adiantum nelumboides]|nr:hypothetical protein [Adiantum nelumboides]